MPVPTQRVLDIVLFFIYTIGSVSGLTILKTWLVPAADSWRSGRIFATETVYVFAGAAIYIVSFLIWMVILMRIQLSIAYPVAVALTLIFTALSARFALGEALSVQRLIGIAVIFAGMLLVTRT